VISLRWAVMMCLNMEEGYIGLEMPINATTFAGPIRTRSEETKSFER